MRFESVAGPDGSGKELTYQCLEGEKSEVPSVVDARFRTYVDHYVAPDEEGKVAGMSFFGEEGEDAEERDVVPVCLKRNLEREGVKEGVDADALASKAIKQAFVVRNGLECKLGTTPARKTKKIAYVLGTEDVMFRTKRPASTKAGSGGKAKKGKKGMEGAEGVSDADAAKTEKFNAWIAARVEEIAKEPPKEVVVKTDEPASEPVVA